MTVDRRTTRLQACHLARKRASADVAQRSFPLSRFVSMSRPFMKLIQVLGPGCPRCAQVAENARLAVKELGLEATIEKVTDLDAILDFGVLMTPGLVIDGEVKLVGTVPSPEEIKGMLGNAKR